MIPVPSGVRVWLAVGRTDMRRGMNGLALAVQEALGRDPHAGDLYVFRGARGDLIKIIWHDGIGMSLYSKRLEQGRFLWPSPADGTVAISAAQLAYMLDGIDWRDPRHTFCPPPARLAVPVFAARRASAGNDDNWGGFRRQGAGAQAFPQASPAGAGGRAGTFDLPVLRQCPAAQAGRGCHRDAGGDPAAGEGDPACPREVHLPRLRKDQPGAGPVSRDPPWLRRPHPLPPPPVHAQPPPNSPTT